MNSTIKNPEAVCLITPPSPFLLDERVFMHIGILKVASSLESKGHVVEFLDLSGIENYLKVVEDYCRSTKIKTFGLTASTPQVPFAVQIAQTIRATCPDSKIILGGPHVTLMHTASKREIKKGLEKSNRATEDVNKLSELFDVLVCGDGEYTIFGALEIDKGIIDADDRKSPYFLTNQQFSVQNRCLLNLKLTNLPYHPLVCLTLFEKSHSMVRNNQKYKDRLHLFHQL